MKTLQKANRLRGGDVSSDFSNTPPISPTVFELTDFVADNDQYGCNVIGHGSMGQVLRVRHAKTGKLFAIKHIPRAILSSASIVEQIEREIEIHSAASSHPNVVKLLAHHSDFTGFHLIMELADESLSAYLWHAKMLSAKETQRYISQLTGAIKYLHDSSIIHRDIKPENILMFASSDKKEFIVKLSDFGWSNSINRPRMTFCGTMDYLPPEMILQESHDKPCDIWALGILTYESLCGKVPWPGGLHKCLSDSGGAYPRASRLRALIEKIEFPNHVHPEAVSFIKTCLRFYPESRPCASDLLLHPFLSQPLLSNFKPSPTSNSSKSTASPPTPPCPPPTTTSNSSAKPLLSSGQLTSTAFSKNRLTPQLMPASKTGTIPPFPRQIGELAEVSARKFPPDHPSPSEISSSHYYSYSEESVEETPKRSVTVKSCASTLQKNRAGSSEKGVKNWTFVISKHEMVSRSASDEVKIGLTTTTSGVSVTSSFSTTSRLSDENLLKTRTEGSAKNTNPSYFRKNSDEGTQAKGTKDSNRLFAKVGESSTNDSEHGSVVSRILRISSRLTH